VYLDELGEKASHWGWLGKPQKGPAKKAPRQSPPDASPAPAE
jgi:hypothetical protein